MKAMLAKPCPARLPAGRWAIEPKLDGFRALWDGSALWSRSGRRFENPPEVLAFLRVNFADTQLDGELCAEDFGTTASTLRSMKSMPDSGVRYWVFDLVHNGETLAGQPFERRREMLEELFEARCPRPNSHLELVPSIPFEGDPQQAGAQLYTAGWEGAMLKNLSSPYLAGVRSDLWLKVKPLVEVDAVIIGADAGQGRFANTLGALTVETGDGTTFRVGTGFAESERHHIWQLHQDGQLLGLPITVSYQPDKRIKGRFPRFAQLRDDLQVSRP